MKENLKIKNMVLWCILTTLISLCNGAMIEPTIRVPMGIMEQKEYLLSLFNKDREQKSLGTLYLDENLSEIAQEHTDYMIEEGFYSHYTQDGRDPSDRAREANFTYVVRQIIEKGNSIRGVYVNFINNSLNLRIILIAQHTRAGIGIGINPDGAIIVTVLFSTRDFEIYPYLQQQISKIHDYVSKYIKARDLYAKTENLKLTDLVQEWVSGNRELDVVDYILEAKFFQTGRITILPTYMSIFPNSPSLADSIANTNIYYFIKNRKSFGSFGIGIGTVDGGKVEIWVVYTS